MKIVYMGTPDFAVEPLERILKAGHQVSAVVTQPDKQRGRGKKVSYTPVKECALQYGIPVLQPVRIKAAEAVAELADYPADLFVVAAFGQLLSEEILSMPRLGCINIHASLLPRYRGAAPIQRCILNGDRETGITIMQMEKGLDTGDILQQAAVPVEANETGDSLHDKLSVLGADLVVQVLAAMEAGGITGVPQKEEESCYASMLTREEGRIRWTDSSERIERLIRGLNSWPSAYTFYKGKMLKIWKASMDERKIEMEDGVPPGTVTKMSADSISVSTGRGALRIEEVQLEGKKRMPVRDFLLGFKMAPGEQLDEAPDETSE